MKMKVRQTRIPYDDEKYKMFVDGKVGVSPCGKNKKDKLSKKDKNIKRNLKRYYDEE